MPPNPPAPKATRSFFNPLHQKYEKGRKGRGKEKQTSRSRISLTRKNCKVKTKILIEPERGYQMT
jgi:hypothetical protein